MKRTFAFVMLIVLMVALPVSKSFSEPFYKGKVLKIIVCTKPGGGFDFYGRLAARFMQRYLPGSTAIVKNIPGAGHIIGLNTVYYSKPDGLTLGVFDRGITMAQIAGVKGIKFDLAKMSWLGSFSSDPRVLVIHKDRPYKTLEQMVKSDKKIKFACHGVGEMQYIDTLLVAKMTGAKNWETATGYAGGERILAMMRGEMDAQFGAWSSLYPHIESGELRPIMFNAEKPFKGYENLPLLKNIASAEYKPMVDLMLFLVVFNRPFAGPPKIPADRLKELREAFEKSMNAPDLKKVTKKANRPVAYIGGKEAEGLIKSALDQPPKLVKLLREAYGLKD